MADVNALLTQRLKKSDKPSSKMAAMAERSASGNLTGFSGIFTISELSSKEKEYLENILKEHAPSEEEEVGEDLRALIHITSEVKAITNQAALLHGERIKKAQEILKRYKEGAFTAWLIATYGNRQTPYNLLQYYEFYESLPKGLQTKVDTMPRQAVYTLASRQGSLEIKQKFLESYRGQTKEELLLLIRELFPLEIHDRRAENPGEQAILMLRKMYTTLYQKRKKLTKSQKQTLLELIEEVRTLLI